jgi:hypothetical protein
MKRVDDMIFVPRSASHLLSGENKSCTFHGQKHRRFNLLFLYENREAIGYNLKLELESFHHGHLIA